MYEEIRKQQEAKMPMYRMIPKPVPVCYIGAGKALKVGELLNLYGVRKAAVITDGSLRAIGLPDPMIKAIEQSGVETVIIDRITPDPTFGVVEEALKTCLDNGCDGVVAMGGGSVLDTAKMVSVCASTGQAPMELAGSMKVKGIALPFIAIPTTAGTGSETTIAAAISMTDTHKKVPVADPNLVPDCAVLDPELTVGLPASITAFTGMDALTHAAEAMVSVYCDPEAARLAKAAVKLIFENLENVMEEPANLKSRENLLVASFLGGMAFTRTMVGYVHGFAHNIGGKYGVPHGLANAVLLPHIMNFYKDVCESELAELWDVIAPEQNGLSATEKANGFIKRIETLNRALGIPERLERFPESGIDAICEAGFQETHTMYPVPKYMTEEDAKEILGKICKKGE